MLESASLPTRERELKHGIKHGTGKSLMSLPTRERELKQSYLIY